MPEPKDPKRTQAASGAGRTRAQVEFDRFKARTRAGAAKRSTASGGFPHAASPLPHPFAAGGPFAPPSGGPFAPVTGLPSWAFPPSLAAVPGVGGLLASAAPGTPSPGGSIGDRLGTTLRLSLDVVNASLAGSARLMSGLYGVASSAGGAALAGAGQAYGYAQGLGSSGGCSCGGGYGGGFSGGCGGGGGGGCGCDSCRTCCGTDCCAILGDRCCQPGVGTCCC